MSYGGDPTPITVIPSPLKPADANYNVTVYLPYSQWALSYNTDQFWFVGSTTSTGPFICFVDKATGNKITLSSGANYIITGVLNFPNTPPPPTP